ncbi:hypothetical protein KVR01_010699 [Diaporthe batatas]|uniref:uncharacterized protein n=1 Tax=Diaporthe batatas TaxID=748121 RepID=UPI001D04FC63|nr:uncharacterized protein KVR01_010699 [Diaporthe batatas]KAG8160062.1 hypothetical protein KVR01_010699 [Diaporthe batatas]
MASSEILSQTLLSITNTKLSQLNKQKDAYNNRKQLLIEGADAQADHIKRARELVEGFKELPSMMSSTPSPLMPLENLNRFIQQAQHDPAVTDTFIQEYESQARNELQVQSNRYAFASLYGQLVNEWISAGKAHESEPEAASTAVGREEARVQRATWEEYVFAAKSTDKEAIKEYLSSVFEAEEEVKDHLSQLKDHLKLFQDNWSFGPHFNVDSLTATIKGMLRSDVLTDLKRATLKDFVGNETVLEEIADVLNVRMATFKSWSWENDLVIDQRRQLNGRYRFYPDEDLLQSIFLHYIGMRWAVEFHGRFRGLLDVWKPNLKPLDSRSQRRLDFFLGVSDGLAVGGVVPGTLEAEKKSHFEDEIFLDQLPKSFEETRGTYGSMDDAETADTRKSHINVVQHLLHMIEADIRLQRRFGKDVTVIRSDFKWFGPSIPHSSIAAVLEFFGVGADWLEFFKKVLEAPMRFKQNPEGGPSRIRRRGTPLSTPLADVFGEALLFCVDFAVNQKADGARLYRLHDDMWLWGDTEACVNGWEVLGKCANVLGLDFNLEKTGSASILQVEGSLDSGLASGLPEGEVTWGFLKLDRHTGHFVIDQDEVDKHIEELRVQLDACKTVFDWIQAWNTYGARFFSNFFGRPANCSARAHVDSMLETFQRIQKKLFPDTPGGAGAHLKNMIAQRFSIPLSDLPDGYVYFPPEFGGLGLKNPFIDLCLIRDAVVEDPDKEVDSFFEQEARDWRKARATFDSGAIRARRPSRAYDFNDLEGEPFMSLEEFRSYRERLSKSLGHVFRGLVEEPGSKNLTLKGAVKAVLEPYQWNELSSYDQWVLQLFSKDMIARFGGLEVVERGLLPLGLMGMLRQSKFQWLG